MRVTSPTNATLGCHARTKPWARVTPVPEPANTPRCPNPREVRHGHERQSVDHRADPCALRFGRDNKRPKKGSEHPRSASGPTPPRLPATLIPKTEPNQRPCRHRLALGGRQDQDGLGEEQFQRCGVGSGQSAKGSDYRGRQEAQDDAHGQGNACGRCDLNQ